MSQNVNNITPEQLATLQAAYIDMCNAEAEGHEGSHAQLIAALQAAGITVSDKAQAREIAADLVG